MNADSLASTEKSSTHVADTAGPASLSSMRRRLQIGRSVYQQWIVGLLLLLCYSSFRQVPGWNDYSRYDLVLALVHDRTTRIDPYHANTGDKALYDGHYYSDKAPGTGFLIAPFYAVLYAIVAPPDGEELDPAGTIQVFALIACAIPTVATALLLLRLLRRHLPEWWALLMSFGFALGTIAFPFATVLFGHAAAACFLFAAFCCVWRQLQDPVSRRLSFAAGLLMGWAVMAEFTMALCVAILLGAVVLYRPRALPWVILGGLGPAVLLLGYNWYSFGAPFSLGYAHIENAAFAEGMGQGLFGIQAPRLATLGTILFNPRGLLRLSPWLAVAPLGLWLLWRSPLRRMGILCAMIVLALLLLNAGYYLPFGGWTPGPRFLVPALPFASVLAAFVPRRLWPLMLGLILYAVGVHLVITATVPLLPSEITDPLAEAWWPRFVAGEWAPATIEIRWGAPRWMAIAALGLAAVLALAGLLLTWSRQMSPGATRAAVVVLTMLVLLVLTAGLPLDVMDRAVALSP